MINLEKIKKIFIDFDGVIVDSNKFKEKAIETSIYKLFQRNKRITEAIDYFNSNAGISRKKKLLLFFKEKEVSRIMKIYANQCEQFFLDAPPTIGLKEFLNTIKQKNKLIKIYVLSGGERSEIKMFLNKNNVLSFFDEILGSDKTKEVHLKNNEVSKNDIFIGDSKNDLNASLNSGIRFILFEEYKSEKSFPKEELIKRNVFLRTKNFQSLMDEIKK
jgi:phosphoglycolate phosphatase-like HAD superfamily hydrolase